MIFTASLCFVLTLSSTTYANQNGRVEQLMEEISSKVASDLTQVARAGVASHNGTLEFNSLLLSEMDRHLKKMEPKLNELKTLAGNSPDLAKDLARRIYQNNDLEAALASDGKAKPRFLAALFIGATQILTDVLNMGLRRE